MNRYQRQTLIPQIGPEGQTKLLSKKILIVGAGGLGSPVATYLTLAGVGEILIADCDSVELTNLNRQFMHLENGVGINKAKSAWDFLTNRNSEIKIKTFEKQVDATNIYSLLHERDIVINCVDNLETRYVVNSACVHNGVPLLEAGIESFFGFVMGIHRGSACFECLFPKGKKKGVTPVLGATAGVVGSVQASEALKMLLGIEPNAFSKYITVDLLNLQFETIALQRNPNCPCCSGV